MSVTLNTIANRHNFVLLHFLFIGLDYDLCLNDAIVVRCSSYCIAFVLFLSAAKSIPVIVCVVFTKIIPGPRLVFCILSTYVSFSMQSSSVLVENN